MVLKLHRPWNSCSIYIISATCTLSILALDLILYLCHRLKLSWNTHIDPGTYLELISLIELIHNLLQFNPLPPLVSVKEYIEILSSRSSTYSGPVTNLFVVIRCYNRFAVLACLRSVRNRSRSRAFVCQSVILALMADSSTPPLIWAYHASSVLVDGLKKLYGLTSN